MKEAPNYFEVEENGFKVTAKWDGCVDLWRDYEGGRDDCDYIHLCDGVDELINLLLKVKAEAKRRDFEGYE